MDNSLLVSLSQQIAAYRAMDVIANNLANASTAGFKRESAKFEEQLSNVQGVGATPGRQSLSFVKDGGTLRDNGQGAMEKTGATFDLAISGKGYFTVQTPAGLRYTRDGHFSLDGNGQIVTGDGYALQGDGGAITINPTDGEIQIATDGTVSSVVKGVGNQLAKIKLVDFANESAMTKQGANLYNTSQAATAPDKTVLRQGFIESSNVQPVIEISKMIEVMRAYEATSTLSKSQDDLTSQAIDKLGTMPN